MCMSKNALFELNLRHKNRVSTLTALLYWVVNKNDLNLNEHSI